VEQAERVRIAALRANDMAACLKRNSWKKPNQTSLSQVARRHRPVKARPLRRRRALVAVQLHRRRLPHRQRRRLLLLVP